MPIYQLESVIKPPVSVIAKITLKEQNAKNVPKDFLVTQEMLEIVFTNVKLKISLVGNCLDTLGATKIEVK